MMPEETAPLKSVKKPSLINADTTTLAALECSSMLNDMKKIDDDIKSELEKIKLDEVVVSASRSEPPPPPPTTTTKSGVPRRREKIKIHNLDSYLKAANNSGDDDYNEFYRLPPSLSSSAKFLASTSRDSGSNLYEKLSEVSSFSQTQRISTAATNTTTTALSKLNDENGEIEVEINKELPTSTLDNNDDYNNKKTSLYDFLTLNLDR
jgi:hypothetical protein